jgi:aminoglycoside phosphotransferase (APT) family kinase protein
VSVSEALSEADRRVDAARLSELLGVQVADVQVVGETSGSANRLRLRLRYEDPAVGLPEQMFLKRNLERFTFPTEMYTTEVRIYRDVLPHLRIEQPAVYAIEAVEDDVRFVILMEDLTTRPGARVGFVLDHTSPDEVEGLLATLAHLHAAWWDGERLSTQLPWLRPPTQNAAMRFWLEIGPRLTRNHLASGHRAALVDTQRWSEASVWPAFERLLIADEHGPHTLVHGDVHASNVYYVPDGPGGLLDWQLALRGCWALDVTYLLTSALTVEDRRGHERDMLRGYLERLRSLGVEPPPLDEAWLRYRQNALYGVMMWLITPDGVHTDEAQARFLQRCLAAADDLETLAALAGP